MGIRISNLIDECYINNKKIASADNSPMMKYLALCAVEKDFKNELGKLNIDSGTINRIYTEICYSDDKKIEQVNKGIENQQMN